MAKGDYPRYDSTEGDYYCSVCNEPWEAYSIRRLEDDWTAPQVAAFKAGQGCPACLTDGELERLGNEILTKQKGPYICDGCLTAAYDEGAGQDRAAQVILCTTMGSEIADHVCEDKDKCQCACRRTSGYFSSCFSSWLRSLGFPSTGTFFISSLNVFEKASTAAHNAVARAFPFGESSYTTSSSLSMLTTPQQIK